jgi:hypothetical protein
MQFMYICWIVCGFRAKINHEVLIFESEVHKYLVFPKPALKITSRMPWSDYLIEPVTVHKPDLHMYIYNNKRM